MVLSYYLPFFFILAVSCFIKNPKQADSRSERLELIHLFRFFLAHITVLWHLHSRLLPFGSISVLNVLRGRAPAAFWILSGFFISDRISNPFLSLSRRLKRLYPSYYFHSILRYVYYVGDFPKNYIFYSFLYIKKFSAFHLLLPQMWSVLIEIPAYFILSCFISLVNKIKFNSSNVFYLLSLLCLPMFFRSLGIPEDGWNSSYYAVTVLVHMCIGFFLKIFFNNLRDYDFSTNFLFLVLFPWCIYMHPVSYSFMVSFGLKSIGIPTVIFLPIISTVCFIDRYFGEYFSNIGKVGDYAYQLLCIHYPVAGSVFLLTNTSLYGTRMYILYALSVFLYHNLEQLIDKFLSNKIPDYYGLALPFTAAYYCFFSHSFLSKFMTSGVTVPVFAFSLLLGAPVIHYLSVFCAQQLSRLVSHITNNISLSDSLNGSKSFVLPTLSDKLSTAKLLNNTVGEAKENLNQKITYRK